MSTLKSENRELRGHVGNANAFDALVPPPIRVLPNKPAKHLPPPVWDEKWASGNVTALWAGIVGDSAYERLPILADALQDADCRNDLLLAACRRSRDCYVGSLKFDISQFAQLLTQWQAFMVTYNVMVNSELPHAVSFTIPVLKSRFDLLSDAQSLAKVRWGRGAVRTPLLNELEQDKICTFQVRQATTVGVQIIVPESEGLSRMEQQRHGWNDVDWRELLAAGVLWRIATERDLGRFEFVSARAQNCALIFSRTEAFKGSSLDNRPQARGGTAARYIKFEG